MRPADRASNPGPLTYEPGVLPTALRGPAAALEKKTFESVGGWTVTANPISSPEVFSSWGLKTARGAEYTKFTV